METSRDDNNNNNNNTTTATSTATGSTIPSTTTTTTTTTTNTSLTSLLSATLSYNNINNNNNNNNSSSSSGFKGHRSNYSNGGNSSSSSLSYFESPLFQSGFGTFLKSGEFSDLTIHSEGKQYHLHRVILAYSSKYFSEFFDKNNINSSSIDMTNGHYVKQHIIEGSEQQQQQQQQPTLSSSPSLTSPRTTYFEKIDDSNYELKGLFIEHFDSVVTYLYEGRVNLTPLNALPLLSLSNNFQIKGLKKYATFSLTSSITKDNAFVMLNKAIHINSEDLITKCITVICKHFNQLIQPHYSHLFLQQQQLQQQHQHSLHPHHLPPLPPSTVSTNNSSSALSDELDSSATEHLESNNNSSEHLSTLTDSGDESDDESLSSTVSQPPAGTNATTTTTSSIPILTASSISATTNTSHSNFGRFGSPSPSNSSSSITAPSLSHDKSLNTTTIHTIPELLSLPVSIMIRLMRQNNLSVSNEAVVYKTIVKYIQANKSTLGEQDIDSLFECVRFPLFNYQQLEEVQENTLIPKSLITEALMLRLRLHEGPKEANGNLSSAPSNSKSPSSSSTNVVQTGTPGGAPTNSPTPSLQVTNPSTSSSSSSSSSSLSVAQEPTDVVDNLALIRRTPRAPYAISLEYNPKTDAVAGGVFYYIGTNGLKEEWSNPAIRGRVRVTFSSIEKGNVTDIVGRTPTECWTMDVPASWVSINLGSSRTMVPTFYSLRHGGNSKADCLRNWTLQGSMDSKLDNSLKA
ncbi:hypothetical protein SAMD00019534_109200 [Acytostelium subglobosum LB1]|uniref:hypothetical protein n=1 Tax=Acytostelium subglobosum LB1 TaxID=1410327 RepID=UPI0006450797|nr:hypothetical protein SAMD00019534_109200 [Acytostelium subglobosum LB1]GAM27744.1 hypothetical protein SAMD00019534_109200 [Acytostelium subglobosum LB1]|eukprot:XP_012749403.1 hypothetical protein SAMD00019534_109200 [Acytostelium subglobosum LB1]